MTCKHCKAFFKRYSCAKHGYNYGRYYGECDCPKCQGYCKCKVPELRVVNDRNADHIDGYDRDDLGESPDF